MNLPKGNLSKRSYFLLFIFLLLSLQLYSQLVIDETEKTEEIVEVIEIDSVWAGHPVGFCLLTDGNRQYIAYYNANRNMVVGQRNLDENEFQLHIMPPTSREDAGGTSTVLGWDSHNFLTIGVDREGYIHVSGNVHAHPLTYFRSIKPNDITTIQQIFKMVGTEENRTTYPHFLLTKENELLYHYRDGGSGNGNEIYNIYNYATKTWSRMLNVPLTDGQGLVNAYQTQPTVMKDGWYHVYWVWRDTPDCSTNHDLSYMKSPDLQNWYSAKGDKITLPATLDQKPLIVDPIPAGGGIINLAAKLCLDEKNRPAFVYHKYDADGNLQFYSAYLKRKKWKYRQLTNWDYRWEFSGNGSINKEVSIDGFRQRSDGMYQVDYWHIKYGTGALLLDKNLKTVGEVLMGKPLEETLELEGDFPELAIRTSNDIGDNGNEKVRYLLKWETIPRNRDKPRPKPWPGPSKLYLYKLSEK